MHAKEIIRLFDSSVRKLKKIYGTEAQYVQIVSDFWFPVEYYPNLVNAAAFCSSGVSTHTLAVHSRIAIRPEIVMPLMEDWNYWEKYCTILTVACHEMAHHLECQRSLTRFIRRIRNDTIHKRPAEIVRLFKEERQAFRRTRQYEGGHHHEWYRIMYDEMGVLDAKKTFGLDDIKPKILARR